MVEGINPITTKKINNNNEKELRILAAMDSCFGLVKPRQHGMAADILSSFLFFIFFGSYRVDSFYRCRFSALSVAVTYLFHSAYHL